MLGGVILDFRDLIAQYLLPIVVGAVLLLGIFITLGVVSRLGREKRDDPAGRAISERRRRS